MKTERTRYPGLYRRGDKWVAVVGYKDPATGEAKQKWLTADTKAGVEAAREDFRKQIGRGVSPAAGRVLLRDYWRDWLAEFTTPQGHEPRPLTKKRYESVGRLYILPALGDVPLRELTSEQVRGFYRTVPPERTEMVHAALSSAMSWAASERGLIPANPCSAVRVRKAPKEEAKPLPARDIPRLLAVARGHRLEPAVALGLYGGLRIAEACALQWEDVNLASRQITVARSSWGPTKSGKVRRFVLPHAAVEILRRWRRRQAEQLLMLGIGQDESTPILTNRHGRAFAPGTLSDAIRAFMDEYGFEGTFHTLRHTCATAMLTAGTDVKTAAAILGHSPQVLLTTYAHAIPDAVEAAADRLDAAFGRAVDA